jgi:hypothetical protein
MFMEPEHNTKPVSAQDEPAPTARRVQEFYEISVPPMKAAEGIPESIKVGNREGEE